MNAGDAASGPVAIAAAPGSVELLVNLANASLTTASSGFVAAASAAPGWCGERWPGRCVAPAITFDQLIERYGEPIFAKVDVEGFEAEALAGLSRPIEAFSFEFTTILRRVAIDCVTLAMEQSDCEFDRWDSPPKTRVRTGLAAGGRWIRTSGSGASGEADAFQPVKDRPR
jgi:FkbM family methyltransferase